MNQFIKRVLLTIFAILVYFFSLYWAVPQGEFYRGGHVFIEWFVLLSIIIVWIEYINIKSNYKFWKVEELECEKE